MRKIWLCFWIFSGLLAACTPSSSKDMGLAEAYGDFFTVGAAVDTQHIKEDAEILQRHFNRLTAENAMKANFLSAAGEGKFTWEEADAIANFARDNNMSMTGHALLWHQETPVWFFAGLSPSVSEDLEILKQRLKRYIDAVVERYGDVVDNWDVVNEVISDDPDKIWRDKKEGSRWYEYFGSEEYIYWAYLYAYEALESREKGSAAGKLYYNDYNTDQKIDKILKMALWLRDEKGIALDGIGMQAHWSIAGPSVAIIENTMQKILDAGFAVKISELDISVYNDYPNGEYKPEAEKDFTEELAAQQAARYAELFTLFRKFAQQSPKEQKLTSVTFWGVSDDNSWLQHFPLRGRLNYPLLFDFSHKPKPALQAILDLQD